MLGATVKITETPRKLHQVVIIPPKSPNPDSSAYQNQQGTKGNGTNAMKTKRTATTLRGDARSPKGKVRDNIVRAP
jgi:hypothetical protein